MSRVAVIGAGVIGLSTAVCIKESIPTAHVTLVADRFNQYTTSDGAGALIVPWADGADEVTEKKWGDASMDHFTKLAASESSSESGAVLTMGIILGPTTQPPKYSHFFLTFNPMPQETAEKLNLGKYHCFTATGVIVEMRKYLSWLTKRFKELGGVVIQKRVHSFKELAGTYDIIVNCAGMGAKELTGDDKLIPWRGQTMRISAPWMKHFLQPNRIPGEIYPHAYPNSNNVVVGGVKQIDKTDLAVNPQNSQDIWNTITNIWPPLKPARLQYEWAGLRPYRSPPRVESELIRYGDKTLKIVHNYGHGSTGVSLSWGTAVHATELVKKMMAPTAKL